MNRIIFWTVLTAVDAGFFLTCIIGVVSTAIKMRKHGKRITIKPYPNTQGWIIVLGIIQGLNAGTTFLSLKHCDFTESVLNKIKIVCYLLIMCSFIFAYFWQTRSYLTEDGIITHYSFFPPESVKYTAKTVEKEIKIKLYTKKLNPYCTYLAKNKEALPLLEKLYDEFDGNASEVKIKSGTAKYLLTLLCTSLIFVGGIFAWYGIEKPVVFIGDKIVKTDSEYAIIGDTFYLYSSINSIAYPDDVIDKLCETSDPSRNIKNEDLAALKKLPNLKYLDVLQNNITDLTTIGELTQLEMLRFGGGSKIEKPKDLSPLKNLNKLKYFSGLGLYEFNDLTLFENMNDLVYFELTFANIGGDLDIICGKENLSLLDLTYCTADDFSAIGKSTKLKYLCLSNTNVTDLSFLETLTELEYLVIDGINAEDYSALISLPKLRTLYAKDTEIPHEIISKLKEKGVTIYGKMEVL